MNGGCSVSTFDAPCHSTLFLVGHIFRPLSFWFSQIFIWVIVSPMENKRDATSAGLGWPLTSNRGTHSTLVPDASTIDASTNPTSTPPASLEPMSTSSDLAAAAPIWTHTQPLLNLQFLSRHTILHISVLTAMHTLPHEWFIRFTSRSLHTPTTNVSYLLRRYQLREFLNVEILNTSSMASREIGNGPCKLQIIGAIILKFLYYMGTILFAT